MTEEQQYISNLLPQRHLLALNENLDSQSLLFGSSPAVTLICGLIAIIVLIVALAVCVCHKRKSRDLICNSRNNGSLALEEGKPTATFTQNGPLTTATTLDENAVKVEVNAGSNSRHSNGAVTTGQGYNEDGRPRSHDQRALPEIPHPSQNTVGTSEDDDEIDGHYDIIVKDGRNGNKPVSSLDSTPITSLASVGRGQNLYEPMDDSDAIYAGVKDPSQDNTPIKASHPYAIVDNIGNAEYAHIDTRRSITPTHRAISRLSGENKAMLASSETLDGSSYSSVPPPPVPDKHFTASQEGLVSNTGESHGSNSAAASVISTGSSIPNTLTASATTASSVPVGVSVIGLGPGLTTESTDDSMPEKREPPYTKVTARESLANIRVREASQMQQSAQKPTRMEVTYESVDYDQIASPTAPSSASAISAVHPDRQSLSSDLYAEIASGENSTRSSMYAKVGDVARTSHAPTPPPVDILKKLSMTEEGDDEIPDPGYSVIKKARPQSTGMVVSHTYDNIEEDGRRSPVYAVVDKSRKNRATVHVSENFNAAGDVPVRQDEFSELYAQVNKPRQRSQEPENGIPPEFVGTGARPKIREGGASVRVTNHNHNSVNIAQMHGQPAGSTSGSQDPGYSTIKDVESYQDDDPDGTYDTLAEPEMQPPVPPVEFDPNYDTVVIPSSDNVTRVSVSPGVAMEIPADATAVSQQSAASSVWVKREHVYQDIGELQEEKERMSQSSRGGQQTSL